MGFAASLSGASEILELENDGVKLVDSMKSMPTLRVQSLVFTYWVVATNIFYFQPYLGKISILTNIFQMKPATSVYIYIYIYIYNYIYTCRQACEVWYLQFLLRFHQHSTDGFLQLPPS